MRRSHLRGADGEGVNELAGERLNSPPKLGGVPARPSSSTKGRAGGVVPKQVVARFYLGTTPSAPLRNGTFFLLAQPPLLFQEGNSLASRSSLTRRKKCNTKAPGFVSWCLMRLASIGGGSKSRSSQGWRRNLHRYLITVCAHQ